MSQVPISAPSPARFQTTKRGTDETRRRGHSTARSSAREQACVRVRRFYPNHEYHHPFSEGTLFRPGSQNDAGNSKSFLGNAACTCTSCSRRDPISSDDDGRPPSRQKFKVKASKLWQSRGEGKGGKGKEAEFMNRCMDQRRRREGDDDTKSTRKILSVPPLVRPSPSVVFRLG